MIDAIACEPHFADHLVPVWKALPEHRRGTFHVAQSIAGRLPFPAHAIDDVALRQTPQAPPVFSGTPTLVASIGDIKVGRRIGLGPFAFLEHGAGQAYDLGKPVDASYAGGPDRDDNAVMLVPNEYSAARWRRAYPQARVEIVGCPKLDELPARDPGPGPVVAISFHGNWPSGAYGGTALYDGYAKVLPELAKRYQVIGHSHPRAGWQQQIKRDFDRAGIEFVPEFTDVCRRADVYVCDNSSTIFEFASTGRPVVLMNAAHWTRGHGPGLRFWDAAHVGVNVDRPADLLAGVERALELRAEDVAARENALGFVYAYRSGAAERAAAVIEDWLGERAVAA